MIKAIAVLIVMIGVNAFLVFAIVKAAVRLDDSLRRYFVTKVGSSEYSVIPMRNTSGTLVGGGDGEEVPGRTVPAEEGKQDYFDKYGNINRSPEEGKEKNPYSGYGGTEPSASQYAKSMEQNGQQNGKSSVRGAGEDGRRTEYVHGLSRQPERGKRNGDGNGIDGSGGFSIPTMDNSMVIPVAEEVNAARYKNSELKDDYRAIRQLSLLDKEYALMAVKEAQVPQSGARGEAVREVLRILDYDAAFALSSLDSEVQKNLLKESLTPQQNLILEEYLQSRSGKFDAIGFYGYVKELSALSDPDYYVFAGSAADCDRDYGSGVQTAFDPEIAEGIRILYKDKLYDYSI